MALKITTRSILCLYFTSFWGFSDGELTCKDFNGNAIKHGEQYMPDSSDLCKVCLCDKGFPTMCRSVSCSPPSCSHWEQVKTECCNFICLDSPPSPTPRTSDTNVTDTTVKSSDSLTTLGLRLVASTVTSFLVLALLLFAVHQLRRKRLILAMRRYSESRRRTDNYQQDLYTPDYFGMACPPYEEPPPPYSPPKPPSENHPDEDPPPYDSVDANHNVNPPVFHTGDGQTENSASSQSYNLASISTLDRSNNRHITLPRQSSQHTSLWNRGTSSVNSLPPLNSFRSLRRNNEHVSSSNEIHHNRGIPESSDLESERASTDFAITSDSETHFNHCDNEEIESLRDLRLSNFLSPNRSINSHNINHSNVRLSFDNHTPSNNLDLQNDAHYPENSIRHPGTCKVTGNDNNSSKNNCDSVASRSTDLNQSLHFNHRSDSFSERVNAENYSVV